MNKKMNKIKKMQIGKAIKKAAKRPHSDEWHRYQLFLRMKEYFVVVDINKKRVNWDKLNEYEMFDLYHNTDHQRFLLRPKKDIRGTWHNSDVEISILTKDWFRLERAFSTSYNPAMIGFSPQDNDMTDWLAFYDRRTQDVSFKAT